MRWRIVHGHKPGSIAPLELGIIAAGLIAAVGVTGALAYQAHSAYRSQTDQARKALQHYSSVAAWQFAREARQALERTARATIAHPVLTAMREAPQHGQFVDFGKLRSVVFDSTCGCGGRPLPVTTYFRYDVDRRAMDVERTGVAGDMARVSALLAAELNDPASPLAPGGTDCALLLDGGPRGQSRALSVLVVGGGSRPRMVYGAISPASSLEPMLAKVAARAALLPTALLDVPRQDSVVSLAVLTSEDVIYSRTRGSWELPGVDSLGSSRFRALVRASLAATAAPRLLPGGLPRSRLPVVLVLAALSLTLFGVAVAQGVRGARLGKARTDFVASVSHELRTPIALVRAHAETLIREKAVSGDHLRFLDVVLRETNRLGRLVENILRASALDRGTLQLEPVTVDASALVRAAVVDFGPLATARNARVDFVSRVQPIVWADPAALTQMIFNILGNAVKYGPAGQTIAVAVDREGDAARLTIDDEGPGIPVRDRRAAFRRYVRLVDIGAGAPAGAGIGLAVVRELAHAQGMTVWLEESPRGGTRVVVSMPLCGACEATETASQSAEVAEVT